MILEMLEGGVEKSVTEISQYLNQTQPAVSHHLSLLKNAGLIGFRRDGRFNRYYLEKSNLGLAIKKIMLSETPPPLPDESMNGQGLARTMA
jgi:DNA-binding transcriptional ArsR family regulator